jgi:hypothetical protein
MKNQNSSSSVADWYRRMNYVRNSFKNYLAMLQDIQDSKCSETFPPIIPPSEGYKEQCKFEWGLRIDGYNLDFSLQVFECANGKILPLHRLSIEALERYTQLRRALEDYIHRDGDYPNPNHMPGGSQLK